MSQTSRDKRPRRGEVWLIRFDPSIGGETRKTRPAIIVSNDSANQALNRVQVVPITSKLGSLYPAEAQISIRGARRKAMADQITTADKERLLRKLGSVADLAAVEAAIRIQLGL